MKKPAAALLLCFIIFSNARAQLQVAIAGGAQNASVIENNNPGWDTLSYKYSSRTGFHIGLLGNVHFSPSSHFYFQPGVFFSNKGRKFSIRYDTSTSSISNVNALQYINYMDIPINLVFKVKLGKSSKIMIGGGPYVAFLYNGREKKETYYKNGGFQTDENRDLEVGTSDGQYNNFDYGVNGLFGFEFGRVFITANYSRAMSDFYRAYNYSGTFRHQVIGGTFGIFLGRQGKPLKVKDRDKDGVPDSEDGCPTVSGDHASSGCPDKDGDGIADKDDKCPGVAGTLKYNGCPAPDSDKDGVNDDEDKCPQIPGTKKYNGCPIPDTDKDGINDESDKCPNLAGTKKYDGCPVPDTDKDGLNDDEDKCPTIIGTKANSGCPENKKESIKSKPVKSTSTKTNATKTGITRIYATKIDDGQAPVQVQTTKVDTVKVDAASGNFVKRNAVKRRVIKKEIVRSVDYAARRIQFQYVSAVLLPESMRQLDRVVKILKNNPDLRITVEGHTSSDGHLDRNILLSQSRAESVKKYFESKGIDPARIVAIGYGALKPLNRDKTPAEQAINRRVELKLSVQ